MQLSHLVGPRDVDGLLAGHVGGRPAVQGRLVLQVRGRQVELVEVRVVLEVERELHHGGGGRRHLRVGELRAPRHVRRVVDVVPEGARWWSVFLYLNTEPLYDHLFYLYFGGYFKISTQ